MNLRLRTEYNPKIKWVRKGSKEGKYMNITLDYYPEGKRKAVTLSYDDGQIHDKRLVDILNKYGVKGTFHLNSARIDTSGYVTSKDVSSIYEGHEVALHTHTHPHSTGVPDEQIIYEVFENRRQLESKVGYIINGMSYPMNSYNDNVVRKFRECGVLYSRTTEETGAFDIPNDFMRWHPTYHHSLGAQSGNMNLKHSHTALLDKAKEFVEYPYWMKVLPLFYIWGHSYEFENDGTWDVIENFCDYISKQDNIWFATNIDIYNYISAIRNLKFSADCSIVNNPSAVSVWIGVDSHPLEVKPGQTLILK